ncbi:unnamed protein product [Boreogadus saida]
MPSSLMRLPGEQRRRRGHSVSILCCESRALITAESSSTPKYITPSILSNALKVAVQPLVLMRLTWKRATLEPLLPRQGEGGDYTFFSATAHA